jgi:hypothetical protein
MASASIDIAAELARLEALTNFELRGEWRGGGGDGDPPKQPTPDHSKSVLRKLAGVDPDAVLAKSARVAPRTVVKPGTRLVREWHGQTHTVLVYADGVEWRGQRYRSLSVLARQITGAHWSGPRFFGLTSRKEATDD